MYSYCISYPSYYKVLYFKIRIRKFALSLATWLPSINLYLNKLNLSIMLRDYCSMRYAVRVAGFLSSLISLGRYKGSVKRTESIGSQ